MKLLMFVVAACLLAAVQAADVKWSVPGLAVLSGNKPKGATINGQIIGGSAAIVGQFPWQVAIVADNVAFCGGSLIQGQNVLTAAHCVYNRTQFSLTFGIVKLNSFTEGRLQLQSTWSYKHLSYNPVTLLNDVALIILPNVIVPSATINFIRMPRYSDVSNTFAGTVATASGWGATANGGAVSQVLNSVTRTVITNAICSGVFGTTTIVNSTICVDASATSSICQGDSGGPLVYKEADGNWTLIGVTSFSGPTCTGYPQGFARVTSFLQWIATYAKATIRP